MACLVWRQLLSDALSYPLDERLRLGRTESSQCIGVVQAELVLDLLPEARAGGMNVAVDCRQISMPQESGDPTEVNTALIQIACSSMPERVHREALVREAAFLARRFTRRQTALGYSGCPVRVTKTKLWSVSGRCSSQRVRNGFRGERRGPVLGSRPSR